MLPDIDVDSRRAKVRTTTIDVGGAERPIVNGIDFLEVRLLKAVDPADDIAVLVVEFLHPLDGSVPNQPPFFTTRDIVISGGDRIRVITVLSASIVNGALEIVVTPLGDTSTYTMTLDNASNWLDPVFESAPFSFAIDCDTRFDCAGRATPVVGAQPPPALDHLARDYGSLRRLMLDRMAVTAPEWTERNPADLGVALVELIADAGDRLSYRQDVVATETYLHTARSRVSVARHLRLVDQRLDNGRAARVPIALTVAKQVIVEQGSRFWDGSDDVVATNDPTAAERAWAAGATVFEAATSVRCLPVHNEFTVHTWDGLVPVLRAGATSAALADPYQMIELAAGDLLLLEQTLDPHAGLRRNPDPRLRHVVRITSVHDDNDPLAAPATESPLPLVVVEWAEADALPFDLPLVPDPESGLDAGVRVAAARGNILIADHGLTLRKPLSLPDVPARSARRRRTTYRPELPVRAAFVTPLVQRETLPRDAGLLAELRQAGGVGAGHALRSRLVDLGIALDAPALHAAGPGRWTVVDASALVVLVDTTDTIDVAWMPLSATAALHETTTSLPAVTLHRQTGDDVVIDEPSETWLPAADLLGAGAGAQAFVVEVESDGSQYLRFGDDRHGAAPNQAARFLAAVRSGGGRRGNVGADTITAGQFGTTSDAGFTDRETIRDGVPQDITAVRNPLPAVGGTDPETITAARIRAPEVFSRQLRAVTLDDYARWLEEHPKVQRAVVRRRWTGSWSTLFCTVDLTADMPRPGRPPTTDTTPRPELNAALEAELVAWVERRRTIRHDIEIDGPLFVPIELHLCISIDRHMSRSAVTRAVADRLGGGRVDETTLGLFHPDQRTFGEPVALSQIYAAAQSVHGVLAVDVLVLRRFGSSDDLALTSGVLEVGPREIVELANDPDRPERGTLKIDVEGGR